MTSPTRTLTSAIASGDTKAFALFYEQWFQTMYVQARAATGRDESFCLDVVQEAMLRVVKKMRPIDDEAGLRRWLRRVIRSCAVDQIRRDVRRARREIRDERPAQAGPSHAVETAEMVAWMGSQITVLDETSARLIHLRHCAGWSLPRISRAVGMPVGTVHRRLIRAMAQLRRSAQEHFDE
jgi:RNA polymerase sigma factor (sigma-70 family)